MPLVQCPECKTEISNQASACPKCGHPFTKTVDTPNAASPSGSKIVLKVMLALFGIFALVCVGIVLFIVVGAALYRHNMDATTSKWQKERINGIVAEETKEPESYFDLGTIDVKLSWPGSDQYYISTHVILQSDHANPSLGKEIRAKKPRIRKIVEKILGPTRRRDIASRQEFGCKFSRAPGSSCLSLRLLS